MDVEEVIGTCFGSIRKQAESAGYDLDKDIKLQVKSLDDTDLYWVDTEEELEHALGAMVSELEICPLLAIDMEYHRVHIGKGVVVISLI